MARPKAIINWNQVGKMLEAGCTAEGIAASIGIDVETLRKRCITDNKCSFSVFSQQKRSKGDDLLRMKQFEVAMGGDKTLLIWLGKNRLGQREQADTETDNKPILDLLKRLDATKPETDTDLS